MEAPKHPLTEETLGLWIEQFILEYGFSGLELLAKISRCRLDKQMTSDLRSLAARR